jgi:hypothetical protein
MWAEQNGYVENINHVYELREAFEQSHPEFGQFRGWQDQMFDLRNQLGGTFDEYRRQASSQNPNAKRYFEKMGEFVRTNYPQDQWIDEYERRTVSAEAYQAINGIPGERYDPSPTPGFPSGDITLATSTPPEQPQQYAEDWVYSLNNINTNIYPGSFGNW